MTVPEPNEFRQLDTFPRLRNCTPKLPYILHPPCFFCGRSPLVVFAPSTAAYTFRFAYRTVFAVFCVFCVLCLLVYRVFFACQFSRNYPHRFFRGFTFSHYDLPFPTRYCISYVRSGLYQLVIRVKGFRVCALHCVRVPLRPRSIASAFHCVRANDLDFAFLHWNLSAWTPRFERVEFCIATARTTLAVSAVAPS